MAKTLCAVWDILGAMEFALVLALASAIIAYRCWRAGWSLQEAIFFGVVRGYAKLWHRCRCNNVNPLPAQGPAILVSNHTCSADPPLLQSVCRRPLCWLSAREHYESHPLIRKLLDRLHCVPVMRKGHDAVAARQALARLQEGRVVVIFPEGNLSGVARGRMRVPRGGAAWLALRSRAPVVPAYIRGGPQTDQLLRSWVQPSRRAARISFGPAVDLQAYLGRPITRQLVEEVAALFMTKIQDLATPKETNTP